MQTHIIKNNKVVNTILATVEEARAAFPNSICKDAAIGGKIGDDFDEGTERFTTPAKAIDIDERIKEFDRLVQHRLDDGARAYGYGDPNRPELSPVLFLTIYKNNPAVPKFQAECNVLTAWIAKTWKHCADVLPLVREGQRPAPTETEFLAELDAVVPLPSEADVMAEIARLTAA